MNKSIRKQSDRILDNLGIKVSMEKLRHWPEYIELRNAYYGVGRLQRFWTRHIRPRWFPVEQKVMREAKEELRLRVQQDLLSEILAHE